MFIYLQVFFPLPKLVFPGVRKWPILTLRKLSLHMEGFWNQSREILGVLGDFSLCITAVCVTVHIPCDTQTVPGFQIAVPSACLKFLETKHSPHGYPQ